MKARPSRVRRVALQALYQWRLNHQEVEGLIDEFTGQGQLRSADARYFRCLLTGVTQQARQLDDALAGLLDRPPQNLDPIEHVVLHLGMYELLHQPSVPWRVVIDQAVALCKLFGGEDSYKYINAVLDRAARNCGRAGDTA